MPTLPKLPYTDNGTKTSVTAFTGITKIGDGALYDGLNMCSDYYPNIATRKGFAKVDVKRNGWSYKPSWDVKATTMFADGSGLLYVGESRAAIHNLEDASIEEIQFGKTMTVEPQSLVSFIRTRTIKPTKKAAVNVEKYEYTFYITLVMSAKYAIVYYKRVTTYTDDTPEKTDTAVYSAEMAETRWTSAEHPEEYALSTWFGTKGATHELHEGPFPHVNDSEPPVFLDVDTQSVVSSVSDDLLSLVIPGLYYKIRRAGDTTTESTGIAVDTFESHTATNYKIKLMYIEDQGEATYLNGAVFINDDKNNPVGFVPNSQITYDPSVVAYYKPENVQYTISWGDAPDGIRGAFISGNRMWVYDEHSIYASALGQYEIFTVDGTDNGGWSVTLPGTKLITGGIEYGGRPVFFTEDSIITVYGGYPSAFSTRMDDAWGVEYGSEQSLQLCAGSLYYLSKAGVMRYSGNVPVCISNDLTRYQLNNGRAGADGRHYYLYAENLARDNGSVTAEAFIYVWDVIRQAWHKWQYTGACGWNDSISAGGTLISNPIFTYVKYEPEDVSHVLFVNGTDKGVYAVPSYDRQKLIPGAIIRDGYFGYNDSRRWDIRLGRFYMNSTNMKILKGVHLRARLLSQPRCKPDGGQDRAARFYVRICYDDANAALDEYPIDVKTGFEEIHTENQPQSDAVAGEIYAERNIYIPIQNRRYESFWLDLSGRERWEFSGLAFEYEASGRT